MRVVGSAKALGEWDLARGSVLTTGPDSYPEWTGVARLSIIAEDQVVEFKFVIVRSSEHVEWEQGHNRCKKV